MAAGRDWTLTGEDIVKLAAAIAADNMKTIAEGDMDITPETVKNIQYENGWNAQAFNRDIIRHWANRNSGTKQVKVIAILQQLNLWNHHHGYVLYEQKASAKKKGMSCPG